MMVQVFVLISSFSMATAFSNGVSIANGPQVTKSLYCGREPLRRMPIHLNVTKCQGYCHARTDVQDKFTISVSGNTYWGGTINVTISAAAASDYIIKGFAASAINDVGTMVGLFQESNDTTVAICHQGKKVEGNTIFHKNADPNRKSIKLQWQGPSQNYDDIKFRVWIVHSHDQIFYLESTPIHSQRNGSKMVNLPETLKKLLGSAAQFKDDRLLDIFENSFMDRQMLGYPDNLDDPFDPLKRLPRPHELIPPASNGMKNVKQVQPRRPQTSQDQNSLPGSSNLAFEGQLVKTPEKPVKPSDSSGLVPAVDSQYIPEASEVAKSGDVKMADKDSLKIFNFTTAESSGKDATAAVPSTVTIPIADTFTATPLLQNTTSDDVNIPTTTSTTTTSTTSTTTTTTMTITSITTAVPTNTTTAATISSKAVTGDVMVVTATTQSNDTGMTAMSSLTTAPSITLNNNTNTDATTTAVTTGQIPPQQPANVSGTAGVVSDMNSTQPLP